jgi:hypothetical protein
VHHAVDIAVEADEQAELGDVLDSRLRRSVPTGNLSAKASHGFCMVCLRPSADAALHRIDLEHHHFDFLRGRNDLARMDVLLGPAHFGDVDRPSMPGSSSTKAP